MAFNKDSAEQIAWLRNFLDRCGSLRPTEKSIESIGKWSLLTWVFHLDSSLFSAFLTGALWVWYTSAGNTCSCRLPTRIFSAVSLTNLSQGTADGRENLGGHCEWWISWILGCSPPKKWLRNLWHFWKKKKSIKFPKHVQNKNRSILAVFWGVVEVFSTSVACMERSQISLRRSCELRPWPLAEAT